MPARRTAALGCLLLVLAVAGCGGAQRPSATAAPRGGAATPGTASRPSARPAPSASPARGPLAGRTVLLDPGHNGGNAAHPEVIDALVDAVTTRKPCDTTGTSTDAGYRESAFTFDVSQRLARLLRVAGARVVLTRPDDTGVGPCITRRAAIGNAAHADAGLSVHADGGPAGGYGFHVIQPAPVPGNGAVVAPSHRLAVAVRDAFRTGTGEPFATYRGQAGLDTRDDLGGLNLSRIPKVFVECGNMRNAADAQRLSSPQYRQRVAAALFAGLSAFLRR